MAPTRVYSSERPSAGKHSWEREETKRRETYLLSIERHNIARLRVFTYLILFASFFYLLTLCVIAVKSLLVLSFSLYLCILIHLVPLTSRNNSPPLFASPYEYSSVELLDRQVREEGEETTHTSRATCCVVSTNQNCQTNSQILSLAYLFSS